MRNGLAESPNQSCSEPMRRQEKLLQEIFAPAGLLGKVLDSYEPRPQQGEMAMEVLQALFQNGILIVEAPTGVGKTLAYLVAAALFARARKQPVVVSSYTKALQDQILEREAPRLRRLIHPDLRIVALKGRGNYLCRRRWDLFVQEEGSTADGHWAVDLLEPWVNTTKTGDFAEAPPLGRRARWLLSRISSDARFCSSPECTAAGGCFYKKARAEADAAEIIVVNHALLMTHAAHGPVLPECAAVIVDEAHMLPEAAVEPFSQIASEKELLEACRAMGGMGEPGVSDRIRKAARLIRSKEAREEVLGSVAALEEMTKLAEMNVTSFFEMLRRIGRTGPDQRLVLPHIERLDRIREVEFDGLTSGLDTALQSGLKLLERFRDAVDEGDRDLEALCDDTEVLLGNLAERIETLEALADPDESNRVRFIDRTREDDIRLCAVPLEVGPLIREHLLESVDSIVLTSATLSDARGFEYFGSLVGVEGQECGGHWVKYKKFDSPFDYANQLKVLVPAYAPDPREPGYEEFLAEEIEGLVGAAGRKSLALFTSYGTLAQVASLLQRSRGLSGFRILVQSRDSERSQIIEAFRAPGKALLLGTATFWYGVDFPGEDLELLIMTRLPFSVPTDPRLETLRERWAERGLDVFSGRMLPEAVLRFRQGLGRLIRGSSDRGVAAILDPRVLRARYSAAFRRVLPSSPQVVDSPAEMQAAVRAWFKDGSARQSG